jgi:hypothetical protein
MSLNRRQFGAREQGRNESYDFYHLLAPDLAAEWKKIV